MKVLFVSNLLYRYGPPITLFRLIEQLQDEDLNLALLSYLDGPMRKDFEVLGLRPEIGNFYDVNIENIRRMTEIIKRQKADRVVVNTVDCLNACFAAHLCKVPYILYVHADNPVINTSLLHLFAFKLADKIIFSSEYQKLVYAPLLGTRPSTVLPNGIPFNRFNPQFIRESREEILVSNNLPKDKKVVSIIGTVCNRKRQDLFIFAAQEILKQRDDVIFLIIGRYHADRTYDKLLKKYIEAGKLQSKIFILDEKESIERYIRVSDLVVNCSSSDVTPAILLEAQALNTPVVAPRINGIPRMLKDGKTGILLRSSSIDDLKAAIEKVLDNREHFEKHIRAERTALQKKYDIKKVARQFEKIVRTTKIKTKQYGLKLTKQELIFEAKGKTTLKFKQVFPYVTRKANTFKA